MCKQKQRKVIEMETETHGKRESKEAAEQTVKGFILPKCMLSRPSLPLPTPVLI